MNLIFAACIAFALLSALFCTLYVIAYLAIAFVRLARGLLPARRASRFKHTRYVPWVWTVFLAALCAGCVRPIDTAVVMVNAAQVTLSTTEDIVSKQERAQRDDALRFSTDAADAKKRTEAVYADYRPIWASYHDAWMRWSSLRNLIAALRMKDAAGVKVDLAMVMKGLDDLAGMLTALSTTIDQDIRVKP